MSADSDMLEAQRSSDGRSKSASDVLYRPGVGVIRLRGGGFAGDFQRCEVRFGASRYSAVMQRLEQVAKALTLPAQHEHGDIRGLITEVRTDCEQGCVVVTAMVPEAWTIETLTAALLNLVPPA